jgi:hypothetical protein
VRVKLVIAREEAQHFQAMLEALKDFFKEFQEFFGGSATLIKIVGDKKFLVMLNLYFFNILRGIQVDFSVSFHLVPVSDFTNVFLVKVVAAQCGEYLVKEPGVDY